MTGTTRESLSPCKKETVCVSKHVFRKDSIERDCLLHRERLPLGIVEVLTSLEREENRENKNIDGIIKKMVGREMIEELVK